MHTKQIHYAKVVGGKQMLVENVIFISVCSTIIKIISRTARALFVKHPKAQGEWWSHDPTWY